MGNNKTCDIHPNEDNFVNFEDTRKVVVEQWVPVEGKKVLFYITFDVCLDCLKRQITDGLEARGFKVSEKWVTDVWQTGRSGKRYTTPMSLPNYQQHLAQEKIKEQEEQLLKLRMGTK